MARHQIHFYATREDLEPVIREIEAVQAFRYVLTGLHKRREVPEYESALEIPSLGRASHDSAPICDSYLVVRREDEIAIREVSQSAGGVRYAIDQLANPRSITFSPGGICRDAFVLYGRAATTGESAEAKKIFALFKKWLRKHFTKHAAFYVGTGALRLKAEGFRLTLATQTPSTFDLV